LTRPEKAFVKAAFTRNRCKAESLGKNDLSAPRGMPSAAVGKLSGLAFFAWSEIGLGVLSHWLV
jgi:hypothetical protein